MESVGNPDFAPLRLCGRNSESERTCERCHDGAVTSVVESDILKMLVCDRCAGFALELDGGIGELSVIEIKEFRVPSPDPEPETRNNRVKP